MYYNVIFKPIPIGMKINSAQLNSRIRKLPTNHSFSSVKDGDKWIPGPVIISNDACEGKIDSTIQQAFYLPQEGWESKSHPRDEAQGLQQYFQVS